MLLWDRIDHIQARFEDYDRQHPEVWELFERFADELLTAGVERYSADAILHRIRWHYAVDGRCPDGFKVNDHFSSRYARKLIAQRPEFCGFFELRGLRRD